MDRNEEDFSVAEDVEESVRRSAKSDTGRVETSRKRKRNHRSPTTSESEHSDDLLRRKHGRRRHRKRQHLAKAFKDEAAQWFTGMDPSGKSWVEIRSEFLSAYAKNKNVASELHTIWMEDAEFTLENFMKKGRKLKAWLNERKTVDETAAQFTGLSYSAQNRFVCNIFVRESPKSLQEAMAYLDGRTTDFHQPRASSRAPGPHTKTLAPRDGKSHRFDIECYNCGRKGHRKAECRSALQTQRGSYSRVIKELDGRGLGPKKPITCYNCKEEGHIAPSFPKKNEKVVRLCNSTSTENTLKLADGKMLTFIFDSGSDCSLVTESLAERLPGKRQVICTRLRGLGNGTGRKFVHKNNSG
ncbi:uncharacterized protein LOC124307435 [Neodiprion virginianus]|uniref:uncharacterized protein LOC124307435 n=1 Tax=Neodiprion virginianus TaxID=2961670 RepID=UPI001EE6D16D|nr:uncharacterized protein LOC124307435 [Neodiprion virginianus]